MERKRTARDYAAAVHKHSQRSKDSHLYPGANYRQLSFFLNGRQGKLGRPSGAQDDGVPREFVFATLHDLSYERKDPSRLTTFDSITGLEALSEHPLPRDNAGQLLFLRGYPSRDWINLLGSKYRIDPELFRRHLTISVQHDLFDLPSLPSASQNIVHLATTTIGKFSAPPMTMSEAELSLQSHRNSLGARSSVVGESMVRRFSMHDDQHYSIEQDIKISVFKRGEGWIAVILLDAGRGLDDGPDGPWFQKTQLPSRFDELFIPTIQFEPKMVFSNHTLDRGDSETSTSSNTPSRSTTVKGGIDAMSKGHQPLSQHAGEQNQNECACLQSTSLLSSELYGQYLNQSLARVDAFYALHDLFAFCACGENQLLNCLRVKVKADTQRLHEGHALQDLLNSFIYHRGIVRDHIERLRSTITCITQRGGLKWSFLKAPPSLTNSSRANRLSHHTKVGHNSSSFLSSAMRHHAEYGQQKALAENSAHLLQQDYENLLHKAEELAKLYEEGIGDIRTVTSLQETQKANHQATEMTRLTFLAFIFIPMSFTSSFFSMSVREFNKRLSIWAWFATTIPLSVIVLVIYFSVKRRASSHAKTRETSLSEWPFTKGARDLATELDIERGMP